MVIEYECRKCKKIVSYLEYNKSKFCEECGTFLQAKRFPIVEYTIKKKNKIKINSEDINLDLLFYEFKKFFPISIGGMNFHSLDTWINRRKQAYTTFRDRFSVEKLDDHKYVTSLFKEWLQFKNNLSWTTLPRTGYKALSDPRSLTNMLIYLQDQIVPLEKKMWHCIKGKHQINGLNKGIISALLHTFDCKNYGVWNNRTTKTLEIIYRPPKKFDHIGKSYITVNNTLKLLSNELSTDLTTIDGFMWFVSKYIQFYK